MFGLKFLFRKASAPELGNIDLMFEQNHMALPSLDLETIRYFILVLEMDENVVVYVRGFWADCWWKVKLVVMDEGKVDVLELVIVPDFDVVYADVDVTVGQKDVGTAQLH